jgi:hypothetical protein
MAPLAYLLGLEGIALLDAWAGDHDQGFTDAWLAEIRRLLDDHKLRGRGVLAERVGRRLFAMDEPVVAWSRQRRGYAAAHLDAEPGETADSLAILRMPSMTATSTKGSDPTTQPRRVSIRRQPS